MQPLEVEMSPLLPERFCSPGTCSMASAVNTLQKAGCGEPEAPWTPCLAAQWELVGQSKERLQELFCSDCIVQRGFFLSSCACRKGPEDWLQCSGTSAPANPSDPPGLLF